MQPTASPYSPQQERVLQTLQACRTPGWMFAAHFLALTFEQVDPTGTIGRMDIGPHCLAADGRVSLAALGVLADVALAAAVRSQVGLTPRLATLSMRLSFAHLPTAGTLRAHTKLQQLSPAAGNATAVAHVEIFTAQGQLCCSGEASFAVLENRHGTANHPMPRASTLRTDPLLSPEELEPAERAVWERAVRAHQGQGQGSFIEQFWGLQPEAGEPGHAQCRLDAGQHVGNRVGHFQGGVLLGLAAATCAAAVPADWQVLDLSAQYLEAGTGPHLLATALPLRTGRNLAVRECRVTDIHATTVFLAQATCVRGR